MVKSLAPIDYYVLGFYIVLMLGIGVYFSKFMKGSKEYFTGGNMLPWWVAGISLYMSNFSAWTFTGAAGFVYYSGLFGFIYFLTWSVSFILGHRITAARWRRSRVISPVEYSSVRYNVTTQQLVAYVLVLSGLFSRGVTLTAVSKIISATIGVNIEIVILIAGIVILIYTLLGGLWAVAITDVVQFIILLAITLIVMPVSIMSAGGLSNFINHVPQFELEHVYNGMKYDVKYLLAVTLFNLIVANWGAAQRYYSVKDEKDAKRVGLSAGLLFLTVPILFGIPPLAARIIWPDLSAVSFFQGAFKPEDLVYVGMVLKAIPNGLIGFFLAAMFAATMSAIDTTYNIDSSVISRDLYGGVINPKASDEKILKVGKYSTIILGIVTVVTALIYAKSELGIFNLMAIFSALFLMPIAIPMTFGLVFKKLPRWSAFGAISLGLVVSATARFVLEYSVGAHIFATIFVTFSVLVFSIWISEIYKKSRLFTALLTVIKTTIIFAVFYLSIPLDQKMTIILVCIAVVYAVLQYFFASLCAKDTVKDREIVEKFFKKLDTPVDVAKEVFVGKKGVSSFPIVGIITMIIGGFVCLLIFTMSVWRDIWLTLIMGVLLVVVGFLMYYFGGRQEKKMIESLSREQ